MLVRAATAADADALRALIVEAAAACTDDFTEEGWSNFLLPNSAEAIARRIAHAEYLTLVCEVDGAPAGVITMRLPAKIDQLFVRPAHWRKGVASALWREARARCESGGSAPRYWVKSSSLGVPLYLSFGFRPVGERTSENGIAYYPMAFPHEGKEGGK